MTNTCADCNNRLGSRTESALQEWWDGAIQAHFTSGTSPEPFARHRILILETEAGEPVMLLEKSSAEDKSPLDRLKDPNVQMHYKVPAPSEYKTGLLKSVYLPACLHFGGVAHTTSMMAARDELLAARDAKSRRQVKLGRIAKGLRVHRTGQPTPADHPSYYSRASTKARRLTWYRSRARCSSNGPSQNSIHCSAGDCARRSHAVGLSWRQSSQGSLTARWTA